MIQAVLPISKEVGLGNPTGTSSGNTLFGNGGIAKQIIASRVSSITSSDFASTSNTVSLKLIETGANSGTFLGTLKLTGVSGSSTDNAVSPPALKFLMETQLLYFIMIHRCNCREQSVFISTVAVYGSGGAGSLSLNKSEAFLSGDTVVATLIDNDLNETGGIDSNTTAVKAKSSSESTSYLITMTETNASSGTFEGTLLLGLAQVRLVHL